ncbi:MAG TPA: DHHA1 domain-containing protein [Bacillales bacterium]|nr:DHHA1 domain-containing protein [Bacillales bacterium]
MHISVENKLFYQDAYLQSFSANVEKQGVDQTGEPYVVLNQTAFYPTGGGQPFDTGTIHNVKVINVEEVDGEIRHYLEKPLSSTINEVLGEIDWERRFDHMQQHAGQHILSAAFDQLFQYKTVGFHLGKEVLTIDLDTENLSEYDAKKAEDLANQIILENRPIETKWVSEQELEQYDLRKETKVKEDIRLVIIPDFDYNGCGGTHPNSTGEIRAVKILNWEKQKKKIRVEFICGNRVIEQFHDKQKVLLELTKLLSAPEKDMVRAVNRLLEEGKGVEKELEQAKERLLQLEALDLIKEHQMWNDEKMIRKVYQQRTIQELQKLARFITIAEENASVFLVSENENRLQLVAARGTAGKVNMKKMMGEILPLLNGKGGGNEAFAQGGGEALMKGEELLQVIGEKIEIF